MRYWNLVNKVLREADIIILVLDARMPLETRNVEIENKVNALGKTLIYVINKSDLADLVTLKALKKQFKKSVFISAKKHTGLNKLREILGVEAKKVKFETVRVGVLGYPNVGKSSLINSLKGRESAPVSSISGYTKSIRNVRASGKIMFLDTPGVIPYNEKDNVKHSMIGTVDHSREKDPDLVVMQLIKTFPGLIGEYYDVVENDDIIESIAKKRNLLKKGNEPDISRTARMILKDWQTGKIVKK